jgi:hypothetical protein
VRPPLRAPAEPPEGMTFVYVIQSLQYCKIGMAANLYIRLSNIRVDNPHSPILIRHWPVMKERAERIEKGAQSVVWDRRTAGDWFEITPELAVETVEKHIAFVAEIDELRRESRAKTEALLAQIDAEEAARPVKRA